jgi:hypothetical protein
MATPRRSPLGAFYRSPLGVRGGGDVGVYVFVKFAEKPRDKPGYGYKVEWGVQGPWQSHPNADEKVLLEFFVKKDGPGEVFELEDSLESDPTFSYTSSEYHPPGCDPDGPCGPETLKYRLTWGQPGPNQIIVESTEELTWPPGL